MVKGEKEILIRRCLNLISSIRNGETSRHMFVSSKYNSSCVCVCVCVYIYIYIYIYIYNLYAILIKHWENSNSAICYR